MSLSFFLGEEEAGWFNNIFSTYCTPADFSGILASCNADSLAIDNEEALFEIVVNSAVEFAVHCVVLEHVSHVVNGEKVVDSNYFDVIALGWGTEYEPADAAKTINTYFCHNFVYKIGLLCSFWSYWKLLRRNANRSRADGGLGRAPKTPQRYYYFLNFRQVSAK